MNLPIEITLRIIDQYPCQIRTLNTYYHRLVNDIYYSKCEPYLVRLSYETKNALISYVRSMDSWRKESRKLLATDRLPLGNHEYLNDSWFIIYNILICGIVKPVNYCIASSGSIQLISPNSHKLSLSVAAILPGSYTVYAYFKIRQRTSLRYIPKVCTAIDKNHTLSAPINIHELIYSDYGDEVNGIFLVRLGQHKVSELDTPAIILESYFEDTHLQNKILENKEIEILGYKLCLFKHGSGLLARKVCLSEEMIPFNYWEQIYCLSLMRKRLQNESHRDHISYEYNKEVLSVLRKRLRCGVYGISFTERRPTKDLD